MTIRRSTRKNVLDWVSVERTAWSGRLEEDQFLARIFDLDKMPSHDGRFETAAGDIWQHRVNNNDGPVVSQFEEADSSSSAGWALRQPSGLRIGPKASRSSSGS